MSPRQLQQKIHSTFDSGTITGLRPEVNSLRTGASNLADYRDHLLREYNKKADSLGLPTGLYFAPFDGGLRYLG